ncbi:MAG: PadR family transcriptional regulator [Candidatus Brockarchaeota archaeon]|nr:PadR family transcriptional regulator [Candidatus Brockarchaeota archaeon]MBO3800871.1 PadR family transcriptional regulator [Candidatus Brockarchaeota archaeon]
MHSWIMPVGGLLPLIVLKILSKNPMHGYQIEEELSKLINREVPEGFIYGLLKRLESKGLVTFQWETPQSGPARKVYKLTEEGEIYLKERIKSIELIKPIINYLLS